MALSKPKGSVMIFFCAMAVAMILKTTALQPGTTDEMTTSMTDSSTIGNAVPTGLVVSPSPPALSSASSTSGSSDTLPDTTAIVRTTPETTPTKTETPLSTQFPWTQSNNATSRPIPSTTQVSSTQRPEIVPSSTILRDTSNDPLTSPRTNAFWLLIGLGVLGAVAAMLLVVSRVSSKARNPDNSGVFTCLDHERKRPLLSAGFASSDSISLHPVAFGHSNSGRKVVLGTDSIFGLPRNLNNGS